MKLIVSERPKNVDECIFTDGRVAMIRGFEKYGITLHGAGSCCDGKCAECKYIETIEEHEYYKHDDGYDD